MAESLPIVQVFVKEDCSGAFIYGVTKRAGQVIHESNNPGQLLAHLGFSPNLRARTKRNHQPVSVEDITNVKAQLDAEAEAAAKEEAEKKERHLKAAKKADKVIADKDAAKKKVAEEAAEKEATAKREAEKEAADKAAAEKEAADKAAADEADKEKNDGDSESNPGGDDGLSAGEGNTQPFPAPTGEESGTSATFTLKDDDAFPAGNVGLTKLLEFAGKYDVTEEQLSADGRESYLDKYDWLKSQFGL